MTRMIAQLDYTSHPERLHSNNDVKQHYEGASLKDVKHQIESDFTEHVYREFDGDIYTIEWNGNEIVGTVDEYNFAHSYKEHKSSTFIRCTYEFIEQFEPSDMRAHP